VRLRPLGMSATNWLPIPAPEDRWWERSSRWNENWQRKPKYSEKTWPSATLSTANPTWPDLGSNPGRRCGNPATNYMSFGTSFADHLNTGVNTKPETLCTINTTPTTVSVQHDINISAQHIHSPSRIPTHDSQSSWDRRPPRSHNV
jgi:hypothetical protein